MTIRDHPPQGSPCWADLWTSDVDRARSFYAELFDWEAQEPNPEFGGYFMFTRQGVPVAGGMGDMGDARADNAWKMYLATDDAAATAQAARAAGAELPLSPMPVGDLGIQAVLDDPTGARLGCWQPLTFPGFTVLEEPGAPSWFELQTSDYDAAVSFYQSVFDWESHEVSHGEAFRYATMGHPGGGGQLAGIMDARSLLPADGAARWSIYWEVKDLDRALADVRSLGGSVLAEAEDTPYGRLAGAADPAGAAFKLRAKGA